MPLRLPCSHYLQEGEVGLTSVHRAEQLQVSVHLHELFILLHLLDPLLQNAALLLQQPDVKFLQLIDAAQRTNYKIDR
jgi:hypothetical protein